MRRVLWLNAALAAAVAAVALFAHFRPQGEPREHALSALAPAQIRTIRIERAGMAPIRLERKGEDWFVSEPFAARAEAIPVRRLLEIAEARSAHRLDASDLARFGLDPPEARLVLEDRSFDFGLVNPVSHEQYVLAGGAVYTVSPRYGTALPASAAELASRRLLAPGETPVGIALPEFSVEQREGKWALVPASAELGQDDLIRWVEQWRLAYALRVEPHAKGTIRERISIALREGGTLSLGVLAREPELVLVRLDENLQYYFIAEQAKRLLAPPGAKP
ncbi:MAG TPA: DUF4340 domain-containing protein [Burkholderiales bacterium]|nr:DUF4340 domain-containing protein [Burkholderiales bacterium]